MNHAQQNPATPSRPAPLFELDERGLPSHCAFNPAREITPRHTKARLEGDANVLLIDCRRPDEWELTHIDGAKLIPLDDLDDHIDELAGDEDREIIVYCRTGSRSLKFLDMLDDAGFNNVRSMAGGINLWNMDIAPGNPIY